MSVRSDLLLDKEGELYILRRRSGSLCLTKRLKAPFSFFFLF